LPSELAKKVTERVNEVVEEETARKLGELNVINELVEVEAGTFKIRFAPLSPCSPLALSTGRGIKDACQAVDGVKKVTVECSGHMQDALVNRLLNKESSPPK
jgi:metal-sulfur cluster biosynthetic enzyme